MQKSALSALLVWAVTAATTLPAQDLAFEVATIKPNSGVKQGSSINNHPGRMDATNVTLRALIRYGLGAQEFQLAGGPAWMNEARYDMSGTFNESDGLPSGPSDLKGNALRFANIKARLMRLLADRFQLQLREEEREMPVYGLSVDKSGSKMTEVPDPLGNINTNSGAAGGSMTAKGATLARLCEVLSSMTERPVIDETGLKGYYDVSLKYSQDLNTSESASSAKDPAAYPSLFTAIREQLGLRLTGKKGSAKVWVVVRAEKPEEN